MTTDRVSRILAAGLALGAAATAQSSPPPWYAVPDNDTVTGCWRFNDSTFPPVADLLVVPSWYQGTLWQRTSNVQWTSSLAGRLGVFAIPSSGGSGSMASTVDNDPRPDWIKTYWAQTQYRALGGATFRAMVQEPQGSKLRNLRVEFEALPNGWMRQTVVGEIEPQPDDEQYLLSMAATTTDPCGVDDVYQSTRCVETNFKRTGGGPLGRRTGNRIDLATATGNAGCIGVAYTEITSMSRFFVSARAIPPVPGTPHKLYELDTSGQVLATFDQPTSLSPAAPFGMYDLAVDPSGPFVYGGQEAVQGTVTLRCFDVALRQFDAQRRVAIANAPFQVARGLAFDPDGARGAGTFWVTDGSGTAWEVDRQGSVLGSVATGAPSVVAAGYDRIEGRLYWFGRGGGGDPLGIQVVGSEFDAWRMQPTGVQFFGDLGVSGATPGGLASSVHSYRAADGRLMHACLARGARPVLYRLEGKFDYGLSCAGGISASGGVPFRGSQTWQVELHGVPDALQATLYLGFQNQTHFGQPLPLELDVIGLSRCAILAALTIPVGGASVVGGSAAVPVPLPNSPSIVGLGTYWQWVVLNPSAPGGLQLSQAGKTVVY